MPRLLLQALMELFRRFVIAYTNSKYFTGRNYRKLRRRCRQCRYEKLIAVVFLSMYNLIRNVFEAQLRFLIRQRFEHVNVFCA